jgi:hypothetical protein
MHAKTVSTQTSLTLLGLGLGWGGGGVKIEHLYLKKYTPKTRILVLMQLTFWQPDWNAFMHKYVATLFNNSPGVDLLIL